MIKIENIVLNLNRVFNNVISLSFISLKQQKIIGLEFSKDTGKSKFIIVFKAGVKKCSVDSYC